MWTIQYDIAGYRPPEGRDVEHVASLDAARRSLQSAHKEAERYGAAYTPSTALLWKGEHDDVTDLYPDRQAVMGPRGGVQIQLP